jgi:hypothetical protein
LVVRSAAFFDIILGDVEEMEPHKEQIEKEGLLKLGFIKATLGREGHPWT